MIRAQILIHFLRLCQLCVVSGFTFMVSADPVVFRPETHKATISSSFYTSEDNFDPLDGTFAKLGEGKYFKANDFGLLWDYVSSNRKAWRFGFTASQTESSDGSFDRKNSGINDLSLGFQYYLRANPFKVKPEFFVYYPIAKVDPATDKSLLNEGAMEVKAGVWIQKRLLTLDNYMYLGVNYRGEGRSGLAEYVVGTKKDFEGIEIGGEIIGFESVTDDEFTDSPTERSAITTRVNGGSLRFYSINPSILSAKAFVHLQTTDAFSLRGSYTFDFQGKSAAKGNTLGFQLVWDLNSTHEEFTKSRRKEKRSDDVDRFNIEATEYDESLFREEAPKPIRKRKKQKSVQQILDEAESYLDK